MSHHPANASRHNPEGGIMKLYTRLLWSVPLLGVAAFSVIGSWYSFAELGGFNVFVPIYGGIAAACLAAAVHIWGMATIRDKMGHCHSESQKR
jgi:hypothetical protein